MHSMLIIIMPTSTIDVVPSYSCKSVMFLIVCCAISIDVISMNPSVEGLIYSAVVPASDSNFHRETNDQFPEDLKFSFEHKPTLHHEAGSPDDKTITILLHVVFWS